MLEIHLTPDDIARVTVMSTYGALTETIFSLDVLRRKRGVRYGACTQDLSPVARHAGFALSTLASSPVPIDLVTLISPLPSLEAGIEAVLAASAAAMRAEIDAARPILTTAPPSWINDLPAHISARRELGRNLAGYFNAALGSHWSRLRAHLEAQAAGYARTLAGRRLRAHARPRRSPCLPANPPPRPAMVAAHSDGESTRPATRTDGRGRGTSHSAGRLHPKWDVFHSVARLTSRSSS